MSGLADYRFEGIIFDVYGTLVDVSRLQEACADICDEVSDFVRLWRAKQLEYAFIRTIMDRFADFEQVTADALDYAVAAYDVGLTSNQRRRLMDAWLSLPLFPDVHPALERLRTAGQRLIILSNGSQRMLAPLLERAGIASSFEAVLSSDQVQAYKPDASLYTLPGERLYARNYELLFVTANGFDVAGAKAAGFTVCRINRAGLPLDRLGHDPDMSVRDFQELADLVLSESGTS